MGRFPLIVQNSGDMFDFSSGHLAHLETSETKTLINMLKVSVACLMYGELTDKRPV
jgi:hypothetical protein